MDTDALAAEAEKSDVIENFREVRSLAESLGITGTPSYVIGKEAVFGAIGYDRLLERIAEARKCNTQVC